MTNGERKIKGKPGVPRTNVARPARDHFWLVRRLARVEKRHKLRVRKIDREHIAAQILVFVAVLTPVVISIAVHFWGRR